MKNSKLLLPMGAICLLVGCSTITTGTTQPITIQTANGVTGAKCELVDSKASRWVINSTPETREITKGDGPLTVTCSKSGFKTAVVVVEETFAGATLGNVLLGGGVGIIVDAASGAAQEYADEVLVWMEPKTFKSASAKDAWFAEKAAYEAEKAAANTPQNLEEKEYN